MTADADDEVTHTATVDTDGDYTAANDSDTATSTVTRSPDLELAISSVNPAGYRVGQDGAYRLTVRNDGGVATDDPTTTSLTLPTGFTMAAGFTGEGDWSCSQTGQVVTCTNSEALDPQTNHNVTIPVEVGPGAPASATANATVSNVDDPDTSDNQASTTDPVKRIDIAVSQFPGTGFQVDEQADIGVEVANNGSAPTVAQTVITDELPTGFTYAGFDGDGWTCSASLQTVTCERDDSIPANSTAPLLTLTVNVSEGAATFTTNVIEARTLDDSNGANDSDSELILVAPKPVEPPPPDPVGQPVTIQSARAKPTRSGFLTVFLACPATSEKRCVGTLTVRSAGKIRVVPGRGKRRRIKIGTATYDIAAGRRFPVSMKMTKAAITALKFRKTLKATAIADATATEVATATRRIDLVSRTSR